jgi:ethanolamine utilization microcompartment shell protein EutS
MVGVPQLSVTVGAVHVVARQVSAVFLAIFAGQFLITGLVTSVKHGFVTVTLNEQMPLLPVMSFAV